MNIEKYIADNDDKELLRTLHDIIITKDRAVTASVGEMMGVQMILYDFSVGGMFKYGLAKVKNYFSLHLLPMYCSPPIHAKYKKLLPNAKFQKGCINFTDQEQMPAATIKKLISECSTVDLSALKEKFKKVKK